MPVMQMPAEPPLTVSMKFGGNISVNNSNVSDILNFDLPKNILDEKKDPMQGVVDAATTTAQAAMAMLNVSNVSGSAENSKMMAAEAQKMAVKAAEAAVEA